MLVRPLSAPEPKPDQILLLQARNCDFDRGGSQSSLFGDFRCGQVTLVQKNLKNDKVAEGNSSCSDSTLKEVNDGMVGTSKHDPEPSPANDPSRQPLCVPVLIRTSPSCHTV